MCFRISYRWDGYSMHILHVFLLWLAYFAQHVFGIHSCYISCLFFFIAWYCFILRVYSSFVYPFSCWYLGCFQSLAIGNKAYMNICVQSFVWTFLFSWVYLRVELLGQCRCMFSFSGNCQIFSWSGCAFLEFLWQCIRILVALYPHQHLTLSLNFSHADRWKIVSHCGF